MMDAAEMFKVFNRHRGDAIVIPGRGGRHWVGISTRPNRDLPLGDPAMGGHASFSMGLALARPGEKIVLFDSEGDLQMGMGILAFLRCLPAWSVGQLGSCSFSGTSSPARSAFRTVRRASTSAT